MFHSSLPVCETFPTRVPAFPAMEVLQNHIFVWCVTPNFFPNYETCWSFISLGHYCKREAGISWAGDVKTFHAHTEVQFILSPFFFTSLWLPFFFFFNCCAQGSAAFRVTAQHSVWHFKFDGILRESQATRTKCSLWTIATIQPPRFTQVWMNCECLLTSARWALSPSLKQDGYTIYSTSSYV